MMMIDQGVSVRNEHRKRRCSVGAIQVPAARESEPRHIRVVGFTRQRQRHGAYDVHLGA